MRVSIFVDNHHRISNDAERVLTIDNGEHGLVGDELNLYLGSRPAETAVIADRLIEKLQHIRSVALRKAAIEGGTITVPGPDLAAGDHYAGMPTSVERHVGYGADPKP